jgi:ABC-2 type transport system permease protein
VRKYRAIAYIAARQTLFHPAAIIGRVAFFALILFVFSRLWRVVLSQGGENPAQTRSMLWYLAITEWLLMSIPTIHLEIEKDVRSGDIAYRLPRPMSYVLAQMAQGAGELLVRMLLLGVAGGVLALWMAGGGPEHPLALLAVAPVGLAACTLGMLTYCVIGVCAFWLQDISPVYWVWQKLAFIFGGLLLPMDFYPEWLRTIAEYTPFYALLYSTGRLALHCDAAAVTQAIARLTIWIALTAALLAVVYRRGLRDLSANGG